MWRSKVVVLDANFNDALACYTSDQKADKWPGVRDGVTKAVQIRATCRVPRYGGL